MTTVFVELENARIELLHPLGEASPVEKFLTRNPAGGVHHVCYEVKTLLRLVTSWKGEGPRAR